MPWKAYAVNALIAAALGAGTNELAIIAILRYILPRKKGEIARRIRDIVATDLLSPEKMRDKMDDPQVGVLLFRHIDNALAGFLERDLPAPDDLVEQHREEFDAFAARLRESALGEYSRRVEDERFARDVIRPFLAERWSVLRDRTPRSFLHRHADKLPDLAAEWVASMRESSYLREKVGRGLDGWLGSRVEASRTAADFLSPGVVAAVEDFAASQTTVIVEQLTSLLRSPEVNAAITDGVMAAIRGELRGQGLVGGVKEVFVNALRIEDDVQGVVRRLPDALGDNFRQPHNQARLKGALREAVRGMLLRDMDATFRSGSARGRAVAFIMDRVWREDNFRKVGERVSAMVARGMDQPLSALLEKAGLGGGDDAVLDEVSERIRRVLAAPATRELLAGQWDEFLAGWRVRRLGRLARFVSEDSRKRVSAVATREVRAMLRARLGEFAEESGVWDIVTNSIENYNDDELAELIKNLARSELRMVTILGGVIGLFVGVAQTFLHSLGLF